MPKRELVSRIGNVLWTDDGCGVRCVREMGDTLALPSDVRMDGGAKGPSLPPFLAGVDALLVFDAIDNGLPPATMKLTRNGEVLAFMGAKKMSLHQTGFQNVIATARLTGHCPTEMAQIAARIPEAEKPAALSEALAPPTDLATACDAVCHGGAPIDFDQTSPTAKGRAIVADALGQGEVSLKIGGAATIMVQESVFAGVWRLAGDRLDLIEVATVPALSPTRAHLPHCPAIGTLTARIPALIHTPRVPSQILAQSATRRSGTLPQLVNLCLPLHSRGDLTWLDEALGEEAVTNLSRGNRNCRITATAQRNVWKVQFNNSMAPLILEMFEVTGMTETALVAVDLSDDAARNMAVIEAIR